VRILSARPIDYTYGRDRAIILRGGEVDADTLRELNAETWDAVERVATGLVIWVPDGLDEGRHYLVQTEG
jgi:hypothetical protein